MTGVRILVRLATSGTVEQPASRTHHVRQSILIPVRKQLKNPRFEKSLYDLIRGLRNHKGNEREYILHSLRECRAEIRGADMGKCTGPFIAVHGL